MRLNNHLVLLMACGSLLAELGFLDGAWIFPLPATEPVAAQAPPKHKMKSGQKWLDMDYGPFLSASIEAPEPRTNIAFKGIAIRLGNAFGGEQNEAVVFDTDLLRYSAGWTGDFVALKGVVFDGEHWAYPEISGDEVFGNPPLPGWGKDGSFADPRPFIYGPLPRDWAHWKGLYLHEQKVVLSYTVGDADVLEMPGLEKAPGLAAFSRMIEVGRSSRDLTVQIAFEKGRSAQVLSLDGLRPRPQDVPVGQSVVVLPEAADGKPGDQPSPLTPLPSDGRGGRADPSPLTPLPSDGQGGQAVPSPLARLPSDRPGERAEQGLLGRWEFEEGQGEVARDQSGNNRLLRLHNAAWEPGHDGVGLRLRGDGYAQLDQSDGIDFLAEDLTFAAWIKTSDDGTILSETAPEGPWVRDGKSLFIRDGRLTFDVGWVGAVASQRTIPKGKWAHVAMTWSHQDGVANLFINGIPAGSGAVAPRQATRGHVFRVGFTAANFPSTPFFKGQIDGFRIYRRQLQAAEVRGIAGSQPDSGLLAVGAIGTPASARWALTEEGQVRLRIPASATPARFKVLVARVAKDGLPRFAGLVRQAAPPVALEKFTHGGPARWPQTLSTRGHLGPDRGPYAMDTITPPENNPWDSWMRFGGFDFFKDSTRAAICTWNGDVWIASGIDRGLEHLAWRRFATGLFQPLGLKIVDDQIYVLGRDQITRLHDLNGDGEADFYENFNNDTMTTEHFHEFALDLQTDAAGNFYYMKAARHARDALHPQHGTLMKVSPDGLRSEIIAKGFRAPNGLEVAPNGAFYTTDQEGYWMPANRLNLIKPGGFHGNGWSWYPEGKPKTFEPPICWIHPRVDRSPSTMAWVTSDRWGPLKDKLLSLSYGVGRIFHVMYETVDGVTQGGITPLPLEFDTGIMRSRFNPADGQLYVCGLFGWAGNKTAAGGFYRVRYTGQALRLPTDLHVTSDGVVFAFSEPLEPSAATDTGNYGVEIWNYRWTENYGSPDFKLNGEKGRDRLAVKSAHLSRDGRTVFLDLPGISPVMQMNIQMNLKAADGAPIQTFIHNTIHHLGHRPGWELLGEEAIAVAHQELRELGHEIPGLKQTFRPATAATPKTSDARVSRLVALRVPAGTAPTPFLPAAPFVTTWEGYIKLDLSEAYTFHPQGRGQVRVRMNGTEIIPWFDCSRLDQTVNPVQLRGGLNRLEVNYESPASGDASLRLCWSNDQVPLEPLPPTALVHEAGDAELARAETRRQGRGLFANRHCAACHAPAAPFENGMPELAREAPSLDDAGLRFNNAWVEQWLADPSAVVPQATMPGCLPGGAETASEARALAAYLGTLTLKKEVPEATAPGLGNTLAPNPSPVRRERGTNAETSVRSGGELFSKLGCIACHLLPGDQKLDGDTRRSLGYVKAKWQQPALVDFLRAPGRDYPWTRMPDFHLSGSEAESLADYLFSKSDPIAGHSSPSSSEEVRHGQELVVSRGCVQCHSVAGVSKRQIANGLEALSRGNLTSGCLADTPAQRATAPAFRFTPPEREALRGLLREDLASLRRDVGPEFAQRQFEALRCAACHQRENAKDFWFSLEALEDAKHPKVINPYDDDAPADKTIHRQRPPLNWAGEKLRPEWMEQLFLGKLTYKPRPKLDARMPTFPAYAKGLAEGLALEHGCPTISPQPAAADLEQAKVGRALAQKGALACVDCHAVGPQSALAGADTATINFAHIPERLRKEYFDRYVVDPARLLPGTMMPRFSNEEGRTGVTAYFDGDARKQFEAIWNYMKTVREGDGGVRP